MNNAKFAQFIHPIYFVFRRLPCRELSEIPANQAEFAPFTHRSHKLHKFHAFRTKIHPPLVHYFQTSDHRERTLENWSESTRFRAVAHSSRKLCEIR